LRVDCYVGVPTCHRHFNEEQSQPGPGSPPTRPGPFLFPAPFGSGEDNSPRGGGRSRAHNRSCVSAPEKAQGSFGLIAKLNAARFVGHRTQKLPQPSARLNHRSCGAHVAYRAAYRVIGARRVFPNSRRPHWRCRLNAVPELTRIADIKLNARVSLQLCEAAISSERRAFAGRNCAPHSPRGQKFFNCTIRAVGPHRRPRFL
jgi:hypothetical protein